MLPSLRTFRSAPPPVDGSPIRFQITGQEVYDAGTSMVAPRGAPWASYTHGPYDKWHRYSLHRGSSARASMFIFGVTAEGYTVTLRVKDVEWPVHFRLHDTDGRPFSDDQVHKLQALLCTKCRDNSLVVTKLERYQTSGFVRDETAAGPTDRPVRKKLLFGRVVFTSTVAFQTCKREDAGLAELYGDLWRPEELRVGDVVNKVMNHYSLIDSGWLEVGRYGVHAFGKAGSVSQDDLELWTTVGHLKTIECAAVAPQRFVSIDIETYTARRDHRGERRFPSADEAGDRIIHIGMVFGVLGRPEASAPKVVLCLGETTSPGGGVETISFGGADASAITDADEAALLSKFAELVSTSNVRCIMGYNLWGFDYSYMIKRATRLGVNAFWYLSPLARAQCGIRTRRNRIGRDVTNLDIPGVVTVDVMERVEGLPGTELPSYKLDHVAEHYLGKRKVDLPIDEMMDRWDQGPDERAKIARYCAIDCELPKALSEKLAIIVGLQQFSSVTHNTVDQLLGRGISTVLGSYACWVAHRSSYVFTSTLLGGGPMQQEGDNGYQGATVLDPVEGIHKNVSIMDFASLYPSIMRTYNTCWSTWVPGAAVAGADGVNAYDVGHGETHSFVTNPMDDNDGRSLIAIMETTLLRERKQCRADAKKAGVDPDTAAVLEVRQQQLKVVANSIYGLTGTDGPAACKAVAATITAMGRTLLERTQEHVEAVRGADGQPVFTCIYGDTDSVFVKRIAPIPDGGDQWAGVEGIDRLAAHVDRRLEEQSGLPEHALEHWSVELENEDLLKVVWFLAKKQYMGKTASGKVMMKGVAIKRSDMCSFAKTLSKEVISAALDDSAAAEFIEGVEQRALGLLKERLDEVIDAGGISYEAATISKRISTVPAVDAKRSDVSLPHALVAFDHYQRTGVQLAASDRVPYVFTVLTDDPKRTSRCAMCPDHAKSVGVPLNMVQILTTQVLKPLQRFMRFFGERCVDHVMTPYVAAFEASQRKQLTLYGGARLFGICEGWTPEILAIKPVLATPDARVAAPVEETVEETRPVPKRKAAPWFKPGGSKRREPPSVGASSTALSAAPPQPSPSASPPASPGVAAGPAGTRGLSRQRQVDVRVGDGQRKSENVGPG